MTDLQLGLLAIGVAAVAAVLVYNRLQERKAVRAAQRAFVSSHADLLDEAPGEAGAKAHWRRGDAPATGMPDARLDYVVELDVARGTLSATVLEHWKALEHRFAQRALIAGSDGAGWRRVVAGDVRSFTALRAALQMVSRSGVVGDAELIEFRSAVEALGAALGATLSAPEMREALDQAHALDRLCADADIQVALHVTGGTPQPLEPGEHAFQVQQRVDGLSLTLDVPRSLEPVRAFEAMARAGGQLAAAGGGRLVDDNGNPVDERALAAIGAELQAVSSRLAAAGFEPGSELALRVFS
ncbi:MAG TPA: cell division protein ZipA C-terminal FtsZ-binding domain-containing protein [Burkholderiales bacterium]